MPRKTKETNEEITTINADEKTNTKKRGTKTTSTKTVAKKTKKAVDEEKDVKKTSRTKTTTKKTFATSKRVSKKALMDDEVVEKSTKTKKPSTKSASKKSSKKATKKSSVKKVTISKRKSTIIQKPKIDVVEYYDLPYRYNQTVVKVLAQTPTNLFIYWDISDKDREKYKTQYGENFFETTKPVLIIHNTTMNYTFEIDINDFANSWYLHINDAKCDYKIELGRRPIVQNPKINTDYIYICSSNKIESPNDHILFDKNQKTVYFRNVKTGIQTERSILKNLYLLRNMGNIYNIFDIYKAMYNNENIEEIYDLSNPSSGGNPSSGSFSSRFK